MYDRILLPTDGSDGVERAVERAADLARTYDAELHVLYVVNTASIDVELHPRTVGELDDYGERVTAETADRARADGVESVTTEVAHGVPHRQILDYVDDHDTDLVVMGTHGRGGLDRYLLGSVTEKVVRSSPAPVLTVRMADAEPEPEPGTEPEPELETETETEPGTEPEPETETEMEAEPETEAKRRDGEP